MPQKPTKRRAGRRRPAGASLEELIAQEKRDRPLDEPPNADSSGPSTPTVPFHRLAVTPGFNPRRDFDPESIRDLAETIAQIGLVQPLVVQPSERSGVYELLAGERRFRALEFLVDEGRLPDDHPIQIVIRSDLDERTRVLLALVENLHREDLHPLDEAETFERLRHELNLSTREIADGIRRTVRHVQLRLQLLNLTDEVRAAFRAGEVNFEIARVLSTAPAGLQLQALRHFREADPAHRTGEAMRRHLRTLAIPLESAIFDPALYEERGGEIYVSDTGGIDPGIRGRYFVDRQLFLELQREELDRQQVILAEQYQWVRVLQQRELPPHLEPHPSGPGAVVLLRNGLYDIDVHAGVRSKETEVSAVASSPSTGSASSSPPPAPPPFRKPPSKGRVRRAALIRDRALREQLARDPEVALRLAIVALVTRTPSTRIRVEAGADRSDAEVSPTIAKAFHALSQALGRVPDDDDPGHLMTATIDETELYEALKKMPRYQLEIVLAALVASATGTPSDHLGSDHATSPPLLTAVARDLRVQIRDFAPDAEYLDEITVDELRAIANDVGLDISASAPKGEIIKRLVESGALRDYPLPELAFRSDSESG